MWIGCVVVVSSACGGGSSDAEPSRPPESSSGAESETATEPTSGADEAGTETAQEGGIGVLAQHGQRYWGVYVLVAAAGAPELEQAAAPLRTRGAHVSVGELGCDEGAPEALGAGADTHAVSVHFTSRADADRFAATLERPPRGIVEVTVRCAD